MRAKYLLRTLAVLTFVLGTFPARGFAAAEHVALQSSEQALYLSNLSPGGRYLGFFTSPSIDPRSEPSNFYVVDTTNDAIHKVLDARVRFTLPRMLFHPSLTDTVLITFDTESLEGTVDNVFYLSVSGGDAVPALPEALRKRTSLLGMVKAPAPGIVFVHATDNYPPPLTKST